MTGRRFAAAMALLAAVVVAVSIGAKPATDVQADMSKAPSMSKVVPMSKLPIPKEHQ